MLDLLQLIAFTGRLYYNWILKVARAYGSLVKPFRVARETFLPTKDSFSMTSSHYDQLPGVHAAPNIQSNPDLYEVENGALDRGGLIEKAMWEIAPWQDKAVLDLGAGTGYHVPAFHDGAQHVFAIEPHGPSRAAIFRRVARLGLERVSVLTGSAEEIPLRSGSVDIVHARFAYFFAPNCEPGLHELQRVIRPAGTAFIIDNDLTNGTFAGWLFKAGYFQHASPEQVEGFWRDRGFSLRRIRTAWHFDTRADLEAVVRLEFGDTLAPKLLADHTGLEMDYGICLYYKHY